MSARRSMPSRLRALLLTQRLAGSSALNGRFAMLVYQALVELRP